MFFKKLKLEDCFDRYFIKIEAECLHLPNTIAKYKEVSKRLVKLIGNINVKRIDEHVVNKLKQAMNERNLSASRKNHHAVLLNNLFDYLKNEEGIKAYGDKKVSKFKIPTKAITYLPIKDVCRLANAPDP